MGGDMKYLSTIVAAVIVAGIAALGVSAFDPESAEAAGSYAPKCGGGKILLNANEFRSFQLHNQTRQQNNLAAFCVHSNLQQAARSHSRDMLERGYFAHGDTGARLKSFGYAWRAYGENIGYNNTSPDAMHRSWMNSAGHRGNIVNPNFREIGVGAISGNFRGSQGVMYTVDFGRR